MQEKSQKKSPIKQRILQFIDSIGITPYEFYKNTGITRGILAQENGISEDNLTRFLAHFSNINITWLLTGNGSMTLDEEIIAPVNNDIQVLHHPKFTEKLLEEVAIPLYNIAGAANLRTLFLSDENQDILGKIVIPNSPRCDGAIYVVGDSMYPLLKSGDIIAYQQLHSIQAIAFGEMYLIEYTIKGDTSLVIKYIQAGDKPSTVKLVSYNTNHQPKDIPTSTIEALALIKFSIRKHTMM